MIQTGASASEMGGETWGLPPVSPVLDAGEIHVWRAELDVTGSDLAMLRQALSDDELARAARFRFPQDRDRFIAARGTLRLILARYLGLDPARLRFAYHCACGRSDCLPTHRKPVLDSASGGDWLHFNLSHADGLALYAVARDRLVGIDLERIRADVSPTELAPGVLSAHEQAALFAMPPAEQQAAFFRLWTCKEAYLKARGLGFALAPDQVEVRLGGDQGAVLHSVGGDVTAVADWSLRLLDPAPGFGGALAVPGPIARFAAFSSPSAPILVPRVSSAP